MLYLFRCFRGRPFWRASQINRIPRTPANRIPRIPVPDRSLETDEKRWTSIRRSKCFPGHRLIWAVGASVQRSGPRCGDEEHREG